MSKLVVLVTKHWSLWQLPRACCDLLVLSPVAKEYVSCVGEATVVLRTILVDLCTMWTRCNTKLEMSREYCDPGVTLQFCRRVALPLVCVVTRLVAKQIGL